MVDTLSKEKVQANAQARANEVLPDGASARFMVDGAEVLMPLTRRGFGTGSIGYGLNGKVQGADGRVYQGTLSLVLVHSKTEDGS